jgi:hypothetical protein
VRVKDPDGILHAGRNPQHKLGFMLAQHHLVERDSVDRFSLSVRRDDDRPPVSRPAAGDLLHPFGKQHRAVRRSGAVIGRVHDDRVNRRQSIWRILQAAVTGRRRHQQHGGREVDAAGFQDLHDLFVVDVVVSRRPLPDGERFHSRLLPQSGGEPVSAVRGLVLEDMGMAGVHEQPGAHIRLQDLRQLRCGGLFPLFVRAELDVVTDDSEIEIESAAEHVAEPRIRGVEAGAAGGIPQFGQRRVEGADPFGGIVRETGVAKWRQSGCNEFAVSGEEVILHDHHQAVVRSDLLDGLLPGNAGQLQLLPVDATFRPLELRKKVDLANFIITPQDGEAPTQRL